MTDRERLRRSIQAEQEAKDKEAEQAALRARREQIRRETEQADHKVKEAPQTPQNEVTLETVCRSPNEKLLIVKKDKQTGFPSGYIVRSAGQPGEHYDIAGEPPINAYMRAHTAFMAQVSGGRGQEANSIIQPLTQHV